MFSQLPSRPLLVDLTIEEGSRLKVIYGSKCGFHAIDLDTSNQIDIYLPNQVSLFCRWLKSSLFHLYLVE